MPDKPFVKILDPVLRAKLDRIRRTFHVRALLAVDDDFLVFEPDMVAFF